MTQHKTAPVSIATTRLVARELPVGSGAIASGGRFDSGITNLNDCIEVFALDVSGTAGVGVNVELRPLSVG
jgi:hypothetical protein